MTPFPPSAAVAGSTTVSARPATSWTKSRSFPQLLLMNRLTPWASFASISLEQSAQSAIGKNGCPSTTTEVPLVWAVGAGARGDVTTWSSADCSRSQSSTAWRRSVYGVDGARFEKTVWWSVRPESAGVQTVASPPMPLAPIVAAATLVCQDTVSVRDPGSESTWTSLIVSASAGGGGGGGTSVGGGGSAGGGGGLGPGLLGLGAGGRVGRAFGGA